jgi:uncharacterized protein (TIGR02271 family)
MASRFSGKIQEGFEVLSSDGKKLGKVVAIQADNFVVEKGFFFPKDYTIALDDIREVRGDTILLSRTQEEEGIRGGFWDALIGAASPGKISSEQAGVAPKGEYRKEEEIRIPLREEEVKASSHVEPAGEVRVTKHVVTEERQVNVPVRREVVTVERVPASNETQAVSSENAFEEQSVTIPIREGVIDVAKESVVREEIQVTKSATEVEQPVSTTVRREVAEVEEKPEVPRKTGTSG